MKRFGTFFTFFGILIAAGCDDKGTDPVLLYTVKVENHETSPYQFPSGVYYAYDFPEPQSSDFDVDAVFRQAIARGVQIRDAWYKAYNSSCAAPGSTIAMPAIVPGGLILRVNERSPKLQAIRFTETSKPNVGWCAHVVRHYDFQR